MDSNDSSESLTWTSCPEGMGNGLNLDPTAGLIGDYLPRIHCGGASFEGAYTIRDSASAADREAILRARREGSIVGLEGLLVHREAHRQAGRKVVWITGCFDPLHAGHVRTLQAASKRGDVLIVGVIGDSEPSPDEAGCAGAPAADRAAVVAAIACVAHVLILDGMTPRLVLERLQPDARCKDAR